MESDDEAESRRATADEVRIAIESLSTEELARLRKAATYCLPGSEFRDFQELINEAIVRTMNAAIGGKGRHWCVDVEFIAFMIMTVRGIADDSRESPRQTKTQRLDLMVVEGATTEDVLGVLGHSHPSTLDLAVENQERLERQERAKADADIIDKFFVGDADIDWIIMGHKDDQSADEIRELSGMSATQYNTARRRFRRGLGKLFPSRSTK